MFFTQEAFVLKQGDPGQQRVQRKVFRSRSRGSRREKRNHTSRLCGIVLRLVAQACGDSELTVHRWNAETANAARARHYRGEADAKICISRWFDSVCAPPKPSFN
jgi:hypothetical protein